MNRDVFSAIADPTRRAIINLIVQQPLNLNAVAAHFPVSRPAISKHIRILTECGLITIRQQGRDRFCEAHPEALDEVALWVAQYRSFWEDKLDALGRHLEETKSLAETKKKKAK